MVRICIWMLRIPFEWLEFVFVCFETFKRFEFAFECFESLSNGSTLHSNASNRFRILSICILILRIPFEWLEFVFEGFETFKGFEFAFECFEFLSNDSNLNSKIRIPIEWLEFALEYFESLSNASNLHSNASNPFRIVRICIRTLRIPFEWFEFAFECFKSL